MYAKLHKLCTKLGEIIVGTGPEQDYILSLYSLDL